MANISNLPGFAINLPGIVVPLYPDVKETFYFKIYHLIHAIS